MTIPHSWQGVVIHDQATADERIPGLLATPAAVRFVVGRGLTGPICLTSKGYIPACGDHPELYGFMVGPDDGKSVLYRTREEALAKSGIAWVIIEGGDQPLHPDWVRSIRDQCVAAGVPFCFRGWGEWQQGSDKDHLNHIVLNNGQHGLTPFNLGFTEHSNPDKWHALKPEMMARVGKAAAGRLLDGREWDQFPEAPHA